MLLQRLFHITKCNRILQTAVRYKNIYSYKRGSNTQIVRKLTVISPFTIMAMWGVVENNNEEIINKTQITTKELLTKADTLFDRGDYKGIYDLLSNYKDSKDVEILWRLCRAIYKISETASDVEAANLIYEGYDLLRMALDIQEDHYALHEWMSIFLNNKNLLDGSTKANIREPLQSFAKKTQTLFLPKLIKATLQWLLIGGIILIKSSIYCMIKILILPISLLLSFALPISLFLSFAYVCSIIFTTNKHDDSTHTHKKHSLVAFPKTTFNDCSDHLYTAYFNDVPSTHRETSEHSGRIASGGEAGAKSKEEEEEDKRTLSHNRKA